MTAPKRHGLGALVARLRRRRPASLAEDYAGWIAAYDTLTPDDEACIARHIDTLAYRPLVSIVMPAYETAPPLLDAAIRSVRAQLYPDWELCVVDDASPAGRLEAVMAAHAAEDPRVKWRRRGSNGNVSAASNTALEMARGEFVALMDHDDIIPTHALYEIAVALNAHPDADIVYTDEDRIDGEGTRCDPCFKTDWNRELFFAQNMINHFGIYRRSMVERVGGFRVGYEGSQDYDLALRIVALTSRIVHVPAVLYHWRLLDTALTATQVETCWDAARRAKRDLFAASGEAATVEVSPRLPGHERIVRPLPTPMPAVTLVVSLRAARHLANVARLLDDLDGIEHLRVAVVSTSVDRKRATTLASHRRIDCLFDATKPLVRLVNEAALAAPDGVVVLLDASVETRDKAWLTELVSLAVRLGTACVGAKVLDRRGRFAEAGIVLDPNAIGLMSHRDCSKDDTGYFGRLALACNVSAVSSVCMAVQTSVFADLGGFDAALPPFFADIDFCLRATAKGYGHVWTPFAEVVDRSTDARRPASARKGTRADAERAVERMRHTWRRELERDPYLSVNLARREGAVRLAFPPRRARPWRDDG